MAPHRANKSRLLPNNGMFLRRDTRMSNHGLLHTINLNRISRNDPMTERIKIRDIDFF